MQPTPKLRELAQRVTLIDCALVPVCLGHGVDSHGQPLPDLDAKIESALHQLVTAGQEARAMLAMPDTWRTTPSAVPKGNGR